MISQTIWLVLEVSFLVTSPLSLVLVLGIVEGSWISLLSPQRIWSVPDFERSTCYFVQGEPIVLTYLLISSVSHRHWTYFFNIAARRQCLKLSSRTMPRRHFFKGTLRATIMVLSVQSLTSKVENLIIPLAVNDMPSRSAMMQTYSFIVL